MQIVSGVYRIINLTNSKFYIGSSQNINIRFRRHQSLLNRKAHSSIHLQRAFDKYGKENFKFEVLAHCPEEYLLKLEQWFIDKLKPEYNILKIAGSSKGRITSEETKRKMSITRMGKSAYWNISRKKSKETKLKMSESGKKKVFTEEHKNNLKIAQLKRSKELSKIHSGENNKSAKLNWKKVEEIRKSDKAIKELSLIYSVSYHTIRNIKNNKTWLAQ